jgi:hypothetical protein
MDIFTERMRGHRFYCGDMPAFFCSTDTEPANIGADVKNAILLPYIIEPVLGYGGYLAIRLCKRGKNNIRFVRMERVVWHPEPLQTGSCLLSDKSPVMEHIVPDVVYGCAGSFDRRVRNKITLTCRTVMIAMEHDGIAHEDLDTSCRHLPPNVRTHTGTSY